jgi:hypothetical protein
MGEKSYNKINSIGGVLEAVVFVRIFVENRRNFKYVHVYRRLPDRCGQSGQ